MNLTRHPVSLVLAVACCAGGCLSVKTESEVKPIHITMDINLKVDKQLEQSFANENMNRPKGNFVQVKSMLDRKTAGIDSKAMLVAREGATDDDRILIAEENARRLTKMKEIAATSGVSLESVQKRRARIIREQHIPAGSGVWLQDDTGRWYQR